MITRDTDGHHLAAIRIVLHRNLDRLAPFPNPNTHQLLPVGEGTVRFVLAILVEVYNDTRYRVKSTETLLISFSWGSSVTYGGLSKCSRTEEWRYCVLSCSNLG